MNGYLVSENKLIFQEGPIDADILDASKETVGECAYDHSLEYLLHHSILELRWIDPRSVREHFGSFLEEPCCIEPNSILQIVWKAWVIPMEFSVEFEDSIEERHETMCVALPVLLAREVFAYGLGPDYNWLYWENLGSAPAISAPNEVYEALSSIIENDWKYEFHEQVQDNEDFIENCHPMLRETLTTLVG